MRVFIQWTLKTRPEIFFIFIFSLPSQSISADEIGDLWLNNCNNISFIFFKQRVPLLYHLCGTSADLKACRWTDHHIWRRDCFCSCPHVLSFRRESMWNIIKYNYFKFPFNFIHEQDSFFPPLSITARAETQKARHQSSTVLFVKLHFLSSHAVSAETTHDPGVS